MKKLTTILLVAFGLCRAMAGGDGWLTDYTKAQAQAKAEKKLLVMDFTGSDWCGWCIKLNKEVFSLGGRVHGLVPDMVEERLREAVVAAIAEREAALKKQP